MQVKIVTRYPSITTNAPGVVESVATAQDPNLPAGTGTLQLDYDASPYSKLAFRSADPLAVLGNYTADLDTGNPTGTTITDSRGRYIVVDVTSATLAAVTEDTTYYVKVVPTGTVLWYEDAASAAASIAKAVRAGVKFDKADFSGLDLSGADLTGLVAKHASFKGCKLVGCNLTSANVSYSDFTGADLGGATLTSITSTGATMTGADELAEVVGGLSIGKRAISASAAAADTDAVVAFTTGSGAALTYTLPAAASSTGRMIFVFKADAGTTAGVIDGNGSELINGGANVSLPTRYYGWLLICDGTGWYGVYVTPLVPGAASGLATLSAGSKVVEDPANATATPTASKIPIANASGYLALGWRVRSVTTPGAYPHAVAATDEVLLVIEGTGAENEVSLPAATGSLREITVVLTAIDGGAGTLVVDPDGTEQINALGAGNPYTSLDAVGDVATFKDVAAGQWWVVGGEVA